jgi:site-specific DNA-cytosine methylase
MTAFGQYDDDGSGSTLKACDYKEPKDLVVSPTVTSKWAKGSGGPAGSETGNLVTQPAWWDGGDTADSLTTTSDVQRMPDKQRLQAVLQPQAFRKAARAQSVEDDESWVADGQANTLNTFDMGDTRTTHAIVEEMVDFGRTSDRIRLNAQTAATLQSGGGGAGANTGLYMVPEEPYCLQGSLEGRSDTAGPQGAGWKHGETFTLNTADRHAVADTHYGVRRLTPVECERLQAFPDGWTEPAGSDSARYKALGNAVTVNTVRWVLGRMLEQS